MDFTVTTHDGTDRHFTGDSSFRHRNDGVLEVDDANAGATTVFGPHGWLSVYYADPNDDDILGTVH